MLALILCSTPAFLQAAPHAAPEAKRPFETAKQKNKPAYAGLNSALWMRWSAEYRALSVQAYLLATSQLNAALRTQKWTAAIEQTGKFDQLPPAVIFDIDETLFDNSPYDAAMVKAGLDYDEATFMQWSESGKIRALPGALEFAQYASRRGVTLFYVTNRGVQEKGVTIQNLHRLGFPIRSADHLLLRGAKPKNSETVWSSDKTERRRFVAQSHRILLLLGDDFNDFLSVPAKASVQQRLQLQGRYEKYWGNRWIILPNPHYGSWEKSIVRAARGEDAIRHKVEALADTLPTPQLTP